MRTRTKLLPIIAAISVGACATPSSSSETSSNDDKDDPRIGESVRNLCFTGSISGFEDYDRRTGIILRKGVNDYYLVKLLGGCSPLSNALRVGFDTRGGSSCLSKGDSLVISSDAFPGSSTTPFDTQKCRVSAIYNWDPDAGEDDTGSEDN